MPVGQSSLAFLRELIFKAKERWEAVPANTRRLVWMLGVGVVAGLVIWVVLAGGKPDFSPLFTDLEQEDAWEIIAFLDEQKIPYELENGGRTVMVPASEVDKLRLSLADKGLPRSGTVGFEIFDRQSLGKTDFERRLDYLRALQGELERTISKMSGIDDVRVHLVLPEETLFVSQEKPASAAVLLKLKPLYSPRPSEIKSIVFLVSRAVQGLAPDNVTVVDSRGNVLFPSSGGSDSLGEDGLEAAGLNAITLTREFENDLARSVEGLLSRVFGPGNAVVRVKADLDLNKQTIERRLFEPAPDPAGLTRSVQELEETFRGTGLPPQNTGPTDANIPGYQAASVQGGESEYSRRETTRNLEINEIREQTIVAPGSVKRLSISVVINRPLDAAQVDAVSRTVAAAIGYDPQRNDQITVTGIPFDTSLADAFGEQETAFSPFFRFLEPYRAYVPFLAALVAVALVYLLGRRRKAPSFGEAIQTAPGGPAVEPSIAVAGEPTFMPSKEEAVEELPEPSRDREQIQIERLIRRNPEIAAKLIHAWIIEE
ncbi:MAG TPA: flagellar M-ring protein FliF [Clostridia bacterium]|nr:flagellar M-ring protein FliF [Clostridia bacterium]